MDERVSLWVRLGLAMALAPAQLVTGFWAVVSPRSWFEHFPVVGPDLVAAQPPFNSHLATDAGAGFLATGVALVAAGLWARRSAVWVALLTYLVFAVPHLIYHAASPGPGLSGVAQFVNVTLLASGVVMAMALAWGATRTVSPSSRDRPLKRPRSDAQHIEEMS